MFAPLIGIFKTRKVKELMTKNQSILGEAIYEAIKSKAKELNSWDLMTLRRALKDDLEFKTLSPDLKKKFVDVGAAGIQELRKAGS